jgi:polyvinyl alcohol dehydrogenase (cytochrome)
MKIAIQIVGSTLVGVAAYVCLTQAPAGAQSSPPQYGTEYGYGILQQQCMACHGRASMPQLPTIAALMEKEYTPEKNYQSLKTLPAHKDLKLTDDQLLHAAESLSGRMMGTSTDGDAKQMMNQCKANPPISDPAAAPAWNGWGNDVANTRFQSAKSAGLTSDTVPRLKVKWAFGFPHATAASAQPAIVAGRVFVGSNAGWVYSLDAATGCVYWSYKLKAMTRDAFSFGPVKGHGSTTYGVFIGDLRGFAYGLDAQTGQELWVTRADNHFTSRITGAPTLYDGKLFVPIASWEGFNAKQPEYPCCTSRGSVVALDANTGKQLWKYYTIPDPPKPIGKNSMGTPLFGPSGVSVWNAPTIDPKHNAVLFGTGEAAVGPVPKTSDAIVAVDIATGKLLWSYQTQSNDVYLVNCPPVNKPENCPENGGPDWDIGNSPILKTLANGKRVVIAGTKNGNVFAVDPDQKGALLWNVNVRPGAGGFVWGGAADDKNVYYGFTSGGVAAIQIATGERTWINPLPPPPNRNRIGNNAAVTAIPGVVFSGSVNGILYGLSTTDGHTLWEFDTNKDFNTVNGVPASGNMMSSSGPVVSGGMLFVGSGYSFGSALGRGNVLLALSPE